jgi:alpha-tubulin suppressor-like RCC1 family protein
MREFMTRIFASTHGPLPLGPLPLGPLPLGPLPLAFLAMLLFALLAMACGKEPAEDGALPQCIPGQIVSCACAGGLTGAQVCDEDGQFETCACDPPRPQRGGGSQEPEPEPVVDDGLNACGGTTELVERVGAPCGDCGDGALICDGEEDLECLGGRRANVCGGCSPMPHAVGDLCGTCGQGRWQCGASGGLVCVGDLPTNECGGCSTLDHTRHFVCEAGSQQGLWRCADPNNLRCVGPGRNACGGTAALAGRPGAACGRCDGGRWVCYSADQVVCDQPETGVNACGGCALLEEQVGVACGQCGGVWECDGINRIRCSQTINVCGSCGELAVIPGTPCGNGQIYACQGGNEVVCVDAGTTNACGGAIALMTTPGTACGECRDGVEICASPNLVACVGARQQRNGCDGCTNLWAEPGESCGLDQVWTCSPFGGGLDCLDELEEPGQTNACGGSVALAGHPGDVCQSCGVYACQETNRNAVFCLGGSPGIDRDRDNCGVCGRQCLVGSSCFNGQCIDDPVSTIAAGHAHVCALLQSGQVLCWGSFANGRLGHAEASRSREPFPVQGLLDAVELAAGSDFSCAVRASGAVACWGSSSNMRLGFETRESLVAAATDVPLLSGVRALSLGMGYGCGINAAGRAICWGTNNQGQLGRGEGETSFDNLPGEVVGLEDVIAVRVISSPTSARTAPTRQSHSACALLGNGEVWCWGSNDNGILANGQSGNEAVDALVPVQVQGVPAGGVALGGGSRTVCVLLEDGQTWCWGANGFSERGNDGWSGTPPAPIETTTRFAHLTQSHGFHNCAITGDHELWCWGGSLSSPGFFGIGDWGYVSLMPFKVPFFDAMNVVQSVGGEQFRCTLVEGGRVYCYGNAGGSAYNVLADGQLTTHAVSRSEPVAVHGLTAPETEAGYCRDGIDNDGNGQVDCVDPACHIDLGARGSVRYSGLFVGNRGNYFQGSCGTTTGPEQIHAWTAPTSGRYVISTEGSQIPTTLYVLTTCQANVGNAELACDVSSGTGGRSRVVLQAEKSRTYFIVVDTSPSNALGPYQLSIRRDN